MAVEARPEFVGCEFDDGADEVTGFGLADGGDALEFAVEEACVMDE